MMVIARGSIFDGVAERLAFDILHHHERAALILAEVVDADDIFVAHVGGQASLLQETSLGFQIFHRVLSHNFDGDAPPEHGILRPVDVRHAASEEIFEHVFPDLFRMLHGQSQEPTCLV